MSVFWTRNAKQELQAIHDYIAQNSPRYAQGVIDRITRKTELLARFPHLGTEVPEYGVESIRELLEYPYRIIYRIRQDRVDVLSIVHGARLLPPNPPGTSR